MDEETKYDEEEFVTKFLEEKPEEQAQSIFPDLETVIENDWFSAAFVAAVIIIANLVIGLTFPLDIVFLLILVESFLFCTIFIWMVLSIRKISR